MEKLRGVFCNIINRPEVLFLVFGFVFGVLFLFLTPPFQVPDEQAHLHRAIETANGIFYNKIPPSYSRYDAIIENMDEYKKFSSKYTKKFHQVSGYSSIMYLSSSLGVKTGALFQNAYLMFYLARFFNLLSWLILIYFAIRITPVFKWQFAIFALLPMSIYEGMSVSADSFVNSFLFLFFAYMFKLVFENKENLKNYQIVIYAFMILISSFLKGCLIYPAFLIFLLKDKRKYLIGGITILFGILIGGLWASHNYVMVSPDVNPELNKEILYTFPVKVLFLIFKSLILNSLYWLKGVIGILGNLDVRFPLFIYSIISIIYFLSFFLIPVERKICMRYRAYSLILILLFFIIVCTALFCTWTPAGFPKIGGFQGRYLISIFPLFFLLFGQNAAIIKRPNRIIYLFEIFVFVILIYTCTVLANVYQFS